MPELTNSLKPEAVVVIRNIKGLHARASAKFVKCAEGFDATVTVTREGHSRRGNVDHGPDDARRGTRCRASHFGDGSAGTGGAGELVRLVEAGFDEDCVGDA